MEEFLKQNPEYKNQSKEIKEQRYELYDEQRQSNINRCILKRKELISNSKKVKPVIKDYKSNEEESDEDNFDLDYNIKANNNVRNSENNFLRKNYSTKKTKFIPKNKYLVTEKSYIINRDNGIQNELTKEDLGKFTCIKNEQKKLKKKSEEKDDHLMRYLKVELDNVQKRKEIRDKLNFKEQKLKRFIKIRDKGIKSLQNERYQDHQNVNERQKLLEEMESSYDQKLLFKKKKNNLEQSNTNNGLEKKGLEKNKSKMELLQDQIKEYEKKNEEYKQKINELFDFKEKQEMEKIIKDRMNEKKNQKTNITKNENLPSSFLMKKKFYDLEEKLEIEKYKREKALIQNMSNFQQKINKYLIENEKKQEKIKNTMNEKEIKRKENNMKRSTNLERVKENIKKNEKEKEKKRQILLDEIERKNLKDFAIKQEKIKMIEERKNIAKQNQAEKEALKLRIQEIIDNENNFANDEKGEEVIQRIMVKKEEES